MLNIWYWYLEFSRRVSYRCFGIILIYAHLISAKLIKINYFICGGGIWKRCFFLISDGYPAVANYILQHLLLGIMIQCNVDNDPVNSLAVLWSWRIHICITYFYNQTSSSNSNRIVVSCDDVASIRFRTKDQAFGEGNFGSSRYLEHKTKDRSM